MLSVRCAVSYSSSVGRRRPPRGKASVPNCVRGGSHGPLHTQQGMMNGPSASPEGSVRGLKYVWCVWVKQQLAEDIQGEGVEIMVPIRRRQHGARSMPRVPLRMNRMMLQGGGQAGGPGS